MLTGKFQPISWDKRRDLIIPGDYSTTLTFCVEHFIDTGQKAIADHGAFFIALSGGSTPKAIFNLLTEEPATRQIDWSNIHLFWGDERAVPPDHPESNYRMAMEYGLGKMPIPKNHIHRMHAEEEIEKNARLYEKTIQDVLKGRAFDLIMLGMGEDGHTASLFPHTAGLRIQDKLCIANYIPNKGCWRMTLTYPCINSAHQIVFYVLGAPKRPMLTEVLLSPDNFERYPSQGIGTVEHRALWIADEAAGAGLLEEKKLRASRQF